MKHIFTHLLAVFFLLFFAGSRLLDVPQSIPQSYAISDVLPVQLHHTLKAIEHRFTKESHTNYASPSVEMDNSDLELSEPFVLIATVAKAVVFAFVLGFLTQRLKKSSIHYQADIRLFSRKYLVLRTLRI